MKPTAEESRVRRLAQQIGSQSGLIADLAVDLAAQQAFAVGAVYINVTGVNPATELGYGTWSAFGAGRVLAGYLAGDPTFGTVEAAIGSATHTHTYTQVVNHTHGSGTLAASSHLHSVAINTNLLVLGGSASIQGSSAASNASFNTGSTAPSLSGATADPSGGVAEGTTATGSSLPAAIVVHFWKRTA